MPVPPLEPVTSSNINGWAYDPVSSRLFIQFKGKQALYQYSGVPLMTVVQFKKAPSPGQFFEQNIKKNFQGQRLPDGQ